MSGFTVGDIFGKTFLSAETIIGGRSSKKVFNATMTNLSVDGTSVPNTGFKQIIAGEVVNGTAAGKNGWAYKKIGAVHDRQNKVNTSGTLDSSDADEFFKNYSGESTGDDKMILYRDDAFNFHPAKGTTAKFKFRYVTNKTSSRSKQSSPYDYVVNIKRSGETTGVSVPTAANSSSYPTITGYTTQNATSSESGYADFTMEFDGDQENDYWSVDMSSRSSLIGQSNFETGGKRFLRVGGDSPESKDIDRVEITLLSITANQTTGCTDTQANNSGNYDVSDNTQCSYTIATVSSFTLSKSVITQGESAVVSWNLSSSNFDEIQLLQDGTNIMPSNKKAAKNSNHTVSPSSIGNHTYQLKVLWNKPNVSPDTSSIINLEVQSPQSYIECTDPNRNKDANGECASCKSGYYLDTASGLCTQCDDPNREKDSSGRCGSCKSGYALKDGLCQKAGCTTEGNYNYDETAVIHDESMCYQDDGTGGNGDGDEDGDDDDELPESLPDENGDAISSQVEPSKFPVIPVVGAVALIGVLLLRRG